MNLDSPDYQHMEFDHPFSVSSESSLGDKTDSYHLDHLRNLVIFGSCNGLIALYHPDQGILLRNPSNKTQLKLPNFLGPDHKIHSSDHLLDAMTPSTTITSWRDARVLGTLVGSCLHWIAFKKHAYQLIVSFNLEDERFREVPIPNVLNREYCRLIELAELGGCLGMCTDDHDDFLVEIWVMKQYRKENHGLRGCLVQLFGGSFGFYFSKSSTKVFAISYQPTANSYQQQLTATNYKKQLNQIVSVCRSNLGMVYRLQSHVKPIGYSKTGDQLLLDVHRCLLLSYDLQEDEDEDENEENQTSEHQPRKRVQRIRILDADDDEIKWNYSFKCVRSLVPVNFNAK
ncbi:uncharacterized protein LOC126681407 [Mercurialis annua]|uniref:uncharacterized protein LOC126681407 n=1 Tax=Mercurialis annua TaxID=3986 RepID=UPI00215E43F7|nr:uncharacterized protein LOC126681407 [Mercurialis annua]